MIKRRLELRTIVEKGLEERRNDLIADMEAIVNKADEETNCHTWLYRFYRYAGIASHRGTS